jgi:hypothetical protein
VKKYYRDFSGKKRKTEEVTIIKNRTVFAAEVMVISTC